MRASCRLEEGRPTRDREPLPTHVRDLEPLPAPASHRLDEGLRELGLALDGPTRRMVEDHLRLLLAWTRAINLTAIRDPVAAVTAHVVDSLAAASLVRATGADRLLDLGSGGGYPGLPLAATVPASALLVESVAKKARFLETAVGAIGLADRVGVVAARAETLARDPQQRGRWPLVTARAVSSLDELVELAFPLLEVGGTLVAWKRGDIAAELAAAARAATALGGGRVVVHPVEAPALEGHLLVAVVKTGPTPTAYPREPALRARRPWRERGPATVATDASPRRLGRPLEPGGA